MKALDLFCGAGGASMGLHRAGFEVVGVDIRPQPRYPFEFHQADALNFPLSGYDLIWASPPCQFASEATPKTHRANHSNLIPATRCRLLDAATPYIIENVEGARAHLDRPVMLCGSMFGLNIWRHRYFEIPFLGFFLVAPCAHIDRPVLVSGQSSRRHPDTGARMPKTPIAIKRSAIEIEWMVCDEITQAIPPAYSEFLGRQVIEQLRRAAQTKEVRHSEQEARIRNHSR